ncbi:hypothetical protein T4D_11071 [Trichinella pseudospiralis]|uniref:Uncharacterized protein n=1 Tax=Trichinella pseudospiralis TaxID=6337 RepID=A0A0V1FBV0_TRIPS|nr:hypothetical protein T4D_11071 [Trichinella pseudospiralis]
MADISEMRLVANRDGSMSLAHESKLKHTGKQKKYLGCSKVCAECLLNNAMIWKFLINLRQQSPGKTVYCGKVNRHIYWYLRRVLTLDCWQSAEPNCINNLLPSTPLSRGNDGLDENNKALADPPAVTANPLQHHSFFRLVVWSFAVTDLFLPCLE